MMFACARLLLVAPLLCGLAMSSSSLARAQEGDATDEAAPRDMASIKIELKQQSGKVIKYDGAVLDWGSDGNISLKQGDVVHDIALRVDRPDEDAKAISLTVGYTKDGAPVIEPQTIASELKKREVIRIEGGIAIAITVTPKASKDAPKDEPGDEPPADEEPKETPKDRIVIDGDDPLAGLK